MKLNSAIFTGFTRKVLQIGLIVFFGVSLFSSGSMAGACAGGYICVSCGMHGPAHIKEGVSAPIVPHACHSGTESSPCDYKNTRALGSLHFVTVTVRLDRQDAYDTGIATGGKLPGNQVSNICMPLFFSDAAIKAPPLYLLNLSMLC